MQVTVVNEKNLPMLAASVQLIGFKRLGTIRTTLLLRQPKSVWQIGSRTGRDRIVPL